MHARNVTGPATLRFCSQTALKLWACRGQSDRFHPCSSLELKPNFPAKAWRVLASVELGNQDAYGREHCLKAAMGRCIGCSGTEDSETSDKSAVVQLLVPQVKLQARKVSINCDAQFLRTSRGPHVNVVLTQVQRVAEVARLLAGVLRMPGSSACERLSFGFVTKQETSS